MVDEDAQVVQGDMTRAEKRDNVIRLAFAGLPDAVHASCHGSLAGGVEQGLAGRVTAGMGTAWMTVPFQRPSHPCAPRVWCRSTLNGTRVDTGT